MKSIKDIREGKSGSSWKNKQKERDEKRKEKAEVNEGTVHYPVDKDEDVATNELVAHAQSVHEARTAHHFARQANVPHDVTNAIKEHGKSLETSLGHHYKAFNKQHPESRFMHLSDVHDEAKENHQVAFKEKFGG